MSDRESFDAFYAREIAPALEEREAERLRAVRRHNWILIAAAGAALAALVGLAVSADMLRPVHFIVSGVVMLGGWVIASVVLSDISGGVKDALMQGVASYHGLTFTHRLSGPPAGFAAFRERFLVPSYDRSTFEDLLEGERGGCTFELFEAHLRDVRTDSKGRTRTVTVFRGQLLRIAFPQPFLGVTLVLRDAGAFNALRHVGGDLKRVGLVDPGFEKTFEVFSTDQVEARYLLTPTFMERMLELERLMHGKRARAAFADGDLLVAVQGGDLFEAGSMMTPLADPARVRRAVQEIETVHAMIDSLVSLGADAVNPDAEHPLA